MATIIEPFRVACVEPSRMTNAPPFLRHVTARFGPPPFVPAPAGA